MVRGRKAQPAAVKRLRGVPGKRRVAPEISPPAPAKPPKPPARLKGEARKEWVRLASTLHRLGILTKADEGTFATYCQLHAVEQREFDRWTKAKAPEDQKAARIAYMDAVRQKRSYLSEMGLSPASRTRILGSAEDPGKEDRPSTLGTLRGMAAAGKR